MAPLLRRVRLMRSAILVTIERRCRRWRHRLLTVAVVRVGLRRKMIALALLGMRRIGIAGSRPVTVRLWRRWCCIRIVSWMPPRRRARPRWSERTVRPSHTIFPYSFFRVPESTLSHLVRGEHPKKRQARRQYLCGGFDQREACSG